MKKNFLLVFLFAFIFCLGFISDRIFIQIKKNQEPFFLKWGYGENKNIGWYTLNDKNGLTIMGNYNSDGLESLNIYDDKKDYHQFTTFGTTYDGPIEETNPPEYGEIIEINSFLTRSEVVNSKELRYYIDDSDDPMIIIQE